MSFISYAQNYEDIMLWRALKHIECGFYVDVGAQDPILHSVTKAFYDQDWIGVNIEPVDESFQRLEKFRPKDKNLSIFVGGTDGLIEFYEIPGTGLSTANLDFAQKHFQDFGYTIDKHTVKVQTLTNILENINVPEIHFLKIDVEGSESSVLQGLDLMRFRPWIILIESTIPLSQEESYSEWEDLIIDYNYHYVYFDGLNRFYIADEHCELDSAFKYPPSVWDDFVTIQQYQLALNAQNLELALQESQQQRERLELALQESQQQREQVQVVLQTLLNSRSMRLTLPLRLVAHNARSLKELIKKSLSIPKSLVKKSSRKILINLAYQLSGKPQLKFIALNLLRYAPNLKHRLKLLTLTSGSSHAKDLEPTHISTLSPHATRIFHDLKEAIREAHHSGINSVKSKK